MEVAAVVILNVDVLRLYASGVTARRRRRRYHRYGTIRPGRFWLRSEEGSGCEARRRFWLRGDERFCLRSEERFWLRGEERFWVLGVKKDLDVLSLAPCVSRCEDCIRCI
jgi:hypothetical protein